MLSLNSAPTTPPPPTHFSALSIFSDSLMYCSDVGESTDESSPFFALEVCQCQGKRH